MRDWICLNTIITKLVGSFLSCSEASSFSAPGSSSTHIHRISSLSKGADVVGKQGSLTVQGPKPHGIDKVSKYKVSGGSKL